MFKNIITTKDKTNLEKEIDRVIESLSIYQPGTKEYLVISEDLERLYKTKALERDRRISPDTIAVVAGNLLGIALILGWEKTGVITSKALGFVLRGRV